MRHLIGSLLGTEEDWPTRSSTLAARVGTFTWRGETHELDVERVFNEPFDLRYRPRYCARDRPPRLVVRSCRASG